MALESCVVADLWPRIPSKGETSTESEFNREYFKHRARSRLISSWRCAMRNADRGTIFSLPRVQHFVQLLTFRSNALCLSDFYDLSLVATRGCVK